MIEEDRDDLMTITVDNLVLQLLAAISNSTNYSLPEHPPEIVFVAHSYLEQQVCGRPCNVKGWFPSGRTIYLDERLDLENDTWAKGILLHELVHYLQQQEGAPSEAADCETWERREQEAYQVQYRWLVAQRVPAHLLRRISRPYLKIECQEANAEQRQ